MKKEIIIGQNKFDFFLFEEFKIWRCLENVNLIQGFELDLEIEIEKFEWEDIEKFISFLQENSALKMKNIRSSKKVLKTYFSEVFKETQLTFEDIDFKLRSVIYKGFYKNVNLSNQFESLLSGRFINMELKVTTVIGLERFKNLTISENS